jgi:hypothetical protein
MFLGDVSRLERFRLNAAPLSTGTRDGFPRCAGRRGAIN